MSNQKIISADWSLGFLDARMGRDRQAGQSSDYNEGYAGGRWATRIIGDKAL